MLGDGLGALREIVTAKVGDKTLLDVLIPAKESLQNSVNDGDDLVSTLEKMKAAAEKGKDATTDMVAKFGRASRLGERSIGVVDPGAASSYLLLKAIADEIMRLI
jgi:dihydroxyacetone kinase-like protein